MGFLMTTEVNECWVFSWGFFGLFSVHIVQKRFIYVVFYMSILSFFAISWLCYVFAGIWFYFFEIYFWKWCQRFDCFYIIFSWCIEFLDLWRTGVWFIHMKSMFCWERLRMVSTFWVWLMIVEEVVVKCECLKNLLGVKKRNFAIFEGRMTQVSTKQCQKFIINSTKFFSLNWKKKKIVRKT